jgi:hypothetical protein
MAAAVVGACVLTGSAAAPAILVGAGIGAGLSYGAQVLSNYEAGLHGGDMWHVNPLGVIQGAFYGALTGAVAGVMAVLAEKHIRSKTVHNNLVL